MGYKLSINKKKAHYRTYLEQDEPGRVLDS